MSEKEDGEHLGPELIVSVQKNFHMASSKSTRLISIPHGYELAQYTLIRVEDSHMEYYMPCNTTTTPVQAIQVDDYLADILIPGRYQTDQNDRSSVSLTPTSTTSQQDQQNFHGPKRAGHDSLTPSDSKARGYSASTLRRHAHARDDWYTDVCGVISPEKATAVKKDNLGNGDFCCPRCGSTFTRPKSVKDHFPGCIRRYGNPQGLHYTDHASMAQTEAFIQRRRQASHETSNADTEGESSEGDEGINLERMNETLYVPP